MVMELGEICHEVLKYLYTVRDISALFVAMPEHREVIRKHAFSELCIGDVHDLDFARTYLNCRLITRISLFGVRLTMVSLYSRNLSCSGHLPSSGTMLP